VKGEKTMFPVNYDQRTQVVDQMNAYRTPLLALVVQPDIKLYKLLADLSPDTPWGERKIAAKRLGSMRSPEALPGLLDALPADPFWMVRCAIIQALEMIGDSGAIPTLREIANSDGFYIVRSHAVKAIERLSQEAQEPV
jgi:HEAT repeat protein